VALTVCLDACGGALVAAGLCLLGTVAPPRERTSYEDLGRKVPPPTVSHTLAGQSLEKKKKKTPKENMKNKKMKKPDRASFKKNPKQKKEKKNKKKHEKNKKRNKK